MTRVVITGGGTGGHIYPALAIAQGLKQGWPGTEILFIGAKGSMESRIAPEAGFHFHGISAAGWQGRKPLTLVKALAIDYKGFREASVMLKSFKPKCVIGTGGYVSLPVGLAASVKGIPVYIHEQNALPGLTNKLIALKAKRIMLSFEEAAGRFPLSCGKKTVLTGLPVRESIINASADEAYDFFNLDRSRKTIAVMGGSQGAAAINRAMLHIIKTLYQSEECQIIIAAGIRDYRMMTHELTDAGIKWDPGAGRESNIRMYPYMDRMDLAYAIADIFIGRSGASTMAEITLRGLPAILIPLPHSAENHQFFNAESLVNRGGAVIIEDKKLSGPVLLDALRELLADGERLSAMSASSYRASHSGALEKIMDVLKEVMDS